MDWTHWEGCDWIITGDGDNALRVFEPAGSSGEGMGDAYSSWVQVASVEGAHAADINCVRWHPKEKGLLATASDDNAIKLWRLKS